MGKGSVCGVYTSLKPMIHFDSKQSQSIFNQNYYKNAMANNCKQCSIRIISHTTTPLPKSYDCVAVYIAGRRTSLVVYGWWPQPPTKNTSYNWSKQKKFHLIKYLLTTFIFTRGQFWPSGIVVACVCLSVCVSVCVCVRQPRACPCHKSRRVQARTTKFGQKVQNNLVKVPIVLGGDWPWPSRSNLTWKAKFTPFWACPRHNS